jgi:hypothetical protein
MLIVSPIGHNHLDRKAPPGFSGQTLRRPDHPLEPRRRRPASAPVQDDAGGHRKRSESYPGCHEPVSSSAGRGATLQDRKLPVQLAACVPYLLVDLS